MVPNKKGSLRWEPNDKEFNEFLARLDAEREKAGQLYEDLRFRLNQFFEARQCRHPEDLTDQTINRLIQKVCRHEEEIRDVNRYALGIARLLYKEYLRIPALASMTDWLPEDDWRATQKQTTAHEEQQAETIRHECMRQCLAKLPPQEQTMMMEYYQGYGRELAAQRKQIAARRGISYNALNIQVHRLRVKLEACLTRCLRNS